MKTDFVQLGDCVDEIQKLPGNGVHLILSDIPYGIGVDDWDVVHCNTNSALLGASPAQMRSGGLFQKRGKPLNGWSSSDRNIPREYQEWCKAFAGEWLRVIKPGGSVMILAGRRLSHRCILAFEDVGFILKDVLAWHKPHAPYRAQRISAIYGRRGDVENRDRWTGWRVGNLRPAWEPIIWLMRPYPIGSTIADNVLEHGVGAYNAGAMGPCDNVIFAGYAPNERGYHVAQKPVALMQTLIKLTTVEGQVVVDPFCGSGTTLVAAKSLNRRYIGFDNDPACVAIAAKRLANVPLQLL